MSPSDLRYVDAATTRLADGPASFPDTRHPIGPGIDDRDGAQSLLASPHLLREFRASGRLSEPHMLDILATRLGTQRVPLTILPPDPALEGLVDPRRCLRHAMVPWRRDGDTLLIATASPDTALGLQAILPDLGPVRPVLALRDEVQQHVAARHRPFLRDAMATRVPIGESCRSWRPATPERGTVFAVCLLLATMALILAPQAVFGLLLAWAMMTLVIAMTLKTAAAVAHLSSGRGVAPRSQRIADLPSISILVPLYRERDIAERLVRRLERLDYPRGRLEIVLALEETDGSTADALRDAALPPWMRVVTVPDGAPRTKPRALNYALDFCEGDIVGIYDAEDAPDPDQLLRVAARFRDAPPDVACLQGVLDYYNARQNWLSRCFTIEYATWFRLVLPGMGRLGLALPLGGTTLFVRRDVLEQVGAWDSHNVTEDADLGFRLARHGWRTEVIATTTGEEASCRTVPWIRQRSRWLKGYIVTYMVHVRRPGVLWRQLGPRRFLGFHAHFVTALSQFVLAPLLWSFWLIPLGLPHPMQGYLPHGMLIAAALLFLLSEVVSLALGAIATRGAGHRHLWPYLPTMHLYYPLGCAAAYKALYELVVCPFYWDKTAHGLSLPDRRRRRRRRAA